MATTRVRTVDLQVGSSAYRRTEVGADPAVWRRLPYSLRVLAENAARTADRPGAVAGTLERVLDRRTGSPVPLFPARLLLQDLLAVPLLVDLAALRDAVADAGLDPRAVDSEIPVDLVVDHSLRVDTWASPDARRLNLALEHGRNAERFGFLRWCERAFDNLRVVPPGKGIMHQINTERLARVVWTSAAGDGQFPDAYPDTLLGTDSHTPMVNGIGVLGWGVGGIEAEAAMLGQPTVFALPRVVGLELVGRLDERVTPTDLVLRVTELLRQVGVVGTFVEAFGPGLATLSPADRATIANMAPEQGATATFFPVDRRTVEFLAATGRSRQQVALVEAYSRAAGMWWEPDAPAPEYDEVVHLDLATVRPSLAGPRRPEDRLDLAAAAPAFAEYLRAEAGRDQPASAPVEGSGEELADGAVVIAAIASCTNTSNPRGMVTAGLVARNAVARGLRPPAWVKTSLTPGSQVVAAMLTEAGLQDDLDALGFHVAGFGCATCNGNSGALDPAVSAAVDAGDLVAVAVVSSNRNFAGRVHPDVRAAYLASPALTVAYALAGTMRVDVTREPLGTDREGGSVFLDDLWPSAADVDAVVAASLRPEMFAGYDDLFDGGPEWESLPLPEADLFPWDPESTYVRRPPYFDGLALEASAFPDVLGARPLALLGDSVTTDDISPSGAVLRGSAAGDALEALGVAPRDFNSYGTRRGNHEVAIRSLFANRRLRNAIVGREGSLTRLFPEGETVRLYDAAEEYQRRGVPLVVIAGKDYGCGSSRDWAAKAPALVGVRAVIAESFERIHRSNLVGMGVLPLQLPDGVTAQTLGLDGSEMLDLRMPAGGVLPDAVVDATITRADGSVVAVPLACRLDTVDEAERLAHGGILPLVWRRLVAEAQGSRPESAQPETAQPENALEVVR